MIRVKSVGITRKPLGVCIGCTALLLALTGTLFAWQIPKGCSIPKSTLSPDGRYGVIVPIWAQHEQLELQANGNPVVEIKTGRVLGTIQTVFGDFGWDRMNWNEVAPCRWSADGKSLLWRVKGKWSPEALVLIKIENGRIIWQRDLLTLAQQTALKRTKEAMPEKYQKAREQNVGNGAAYPDGFTIDVFTDDKRTGLLSFPVKIRANLTSVPKQNPDLIDVSSVLDASIDKDGKFFVTHFRIITKEKWAEIEESTDSE